MRGSTRHDPRHRPLTTEERDWGTLELLVEQRRKARAAAHSAERQVAVVRDIADDVADLVEPAVHEALLPAAAERERDVPDAVARRARQEREQAVADRLFVARDCRHGCEPCCETVRILKCEQQHQHVHESLRARSRTTFGSNRCSASRTRAARVSGVSPGITGTRSCAMIAPRSNSSSAKCTVAPDSFAPRASTASCTWWPYIPGPPTSGHQAGWMV